MEHKRVPISEQILCVLFALKEIIVIGLLILIFG